MMVLTRASEQSVRFPGWGIHFVAAAGPSSCYGIRPDSPPPMSERQLAIEAAQMNPE